MTQWLMVVGIAASGLFLYVATRPYGEILDGTWSDFLKALKRLTRSS